MDTLQETFQRHDVTFYTIGNDAYFPGLVGLLNSLRLVGHQDPLVVADCGLTSKQRQLLKPHCTLFELPSDLVKNPGQYKPFAHLLGPKATVVIIDSDMIVTKSLNFVLAAAADGKICVFPDPEKDRWFAEWQPIFGLSSPLRRQTYACSGLVAFSTSHWPELLEHWWAACERIHAHPTYQERAADGPVTQSDQDALNALLMSEIPSNAMAFLPFEEQVFRWNFRDVELVNPETLRCRLQGVEPMVLHACLTPKPWQRAGVRRNAYVQALRRLLTASDVEVTVPPELLGPWLRQGPWAEVVCSALSVANMANPDDGVLPAKAVALVRRVKRRFV
jgi:hypothetical protein